MKKVISAVLSVLCVFFMLFSLSACNTNVIKSPDKEYVTRSKTISYIHFDTASVLSSYGDMTDEQFDSYVKTADEILERYHKLFDIYYEYAGINNIRTINNNAGKSPVEVDEELIDFLVYCKDLYNTTGGKTNIMFGSVLKIWHDKREQADENGGYLAEELLPSQDELSRANEHTSIDLLIIDEAAGTVYISDPNASIDVGAIAKGYAASKVAQAIKAQGGDSMAVNAGGNIVTIGIKPGGKNWVTGITNPDKLADNSIICRVEIGETSLVTSGNYERYFVSGDVCYNHIIDPETLMPADYFASVSIFTQDGALADALSTALFCMSYEDGLALIESLSDTEALWILKDGTIKHTNGVHLAN